MLSLVTGGAGFLGSHLTASLVADGHEVIIVDNLSSGRIANLEHAISSGRAAFLYADVAVPNQEIAAAIAKATNGRRIGAIFHLASPASPEHYGSHPWETLRVNSIGTLSLIELALAHGARFIFASTSEIYGDPLVHPQPENYFGNVDPVGPRSCYDEGKRFGEAAVATGMRALGLDARIVRFFNCYGPLMHAGDGRIIPEFMAAALEGRPFPIHGTGRQTRSLTYVDDAITLLRLVAESSSSGIRPVNIGNDEERSVEDIARLVAQVAGVPFRAAYLSPRSQDPQQRKPELTRASEYGWKPSTCLADGLRETYRWFKEERVAFA